MKKQFLFLFSVFFVLGGIGNEAEVFAHQPQPRWSAEDSHVEDTNTHLWIVNQAMKLYQTDTQASEVQKKWINFLQTHQKIIAQGLFDADHMNPYFDKYTFASHFYDPDTQRTYLPGFANARDTGVKYFDQSVNTFKKGDTSQAMYQLGLALHYFTDLTQPMHAGNFTFLSWPIGYHSKYENYVDEIKHKAVVSDGILFDFHSSRHPQNWLVQSAQFSKNNLSKITRREITNAYKWATFSNYYALKWRTMVTQPTLEQLHYAQRVTAGYLNLWMEKAIVEQNK